MKKHVLIILATIILSHGCEDLFSDSSLPETDPGKMIISIYGGNDQTAELNYQLDDSITVLVTDLDGKPVEGTSIIFVPGMHCGNVSPDWTHSNSSGEASTAWNLGMTTGVQTLRAYICDSVANYYDSVTFTAIGEPISTWGKSTISNCFGNASFFESEGIVYVLNNNSVYYSTNDGVNWHLLPYARQILSTRYMYQDDRLFTSYFGGYWLEMGKTKGGIYYLICEYEGPYLSEDTELWQPMNYGLTGRKYLSDFLIEDSVMFMIYREDGIYQSLDKGKSWQQITSSQNAYLTFRQISRHPDGTLYVIDSSKDFWKSTDNGSHWERVNASANLDIYSPTDFFISDSGYLYVSDYNASMHVISPDFSEVIVHSLSQDTADYDYTQELHNFNGALYFLVRKNISQDIVITSETWSPAEGWPQDLNIYDFFITSKGTKLVASEQGLFYYKTENNTE